MTLVEAIKQAVLTQDSKLAGDISDQLRFGHNLNYEQIYYVVAEVCPEVSIADWDAMLYEADEMAAYA